jgi:hypothetical protein
MTTTRPARKSLVQLTYELIEADARKAKRVKKEPEPEAPVKKATAKKGRKT